MQNFNSTFISMHHPSFEYIKSRPFPFIKKGLLYIYNIAYTYLKSQLTCGLWRISSRSVVCRIEQLYILQKNTPSSQILLPFVLFPLFLSPLRQKKRSCFCRNAFCTCQNLCVGFGLLTRICPSCVRRSTNFRLIHLDFHLSCPKVRQLWTLSLGFLPNLSEGDLSSDSSNRIPSGLVRTVKRGTSVQSLLSNIAPSTLLLIPLE